MAEVLPILEKRNTDVSRLHWDIKTKIYGSIFPTILEYKATEKLKWYTRKTKLQLKDLRSVQPQYTLGDEFHKLNQLFFKYFKIPDHLEEIASSFELENTLGIHFRGTDKTNDRDNTNISKDDFYIIFDSFIKKHPFKIIFLATDENDVYTYLVSKYPDIKIKHSRTFDGQTIFWKIKPDSVQNAKEAMVDMLCLSKCKMVLKVSSALSSFAKLVNPDLEIYRLNALKMFNDIPYFPDAYIPLLRKDVIYSEHCNSILGMVQKDDWSLEHGERFSNFFYKERRID
ncbi:MAG: hypothetical protein ABI761_07280 [Saprospiraceae bacterium]